MPAIAIAIASAFLCLFVPTLTGWLLSTTLLTADQEVSWPPGDRTMGSEHQILITLSPWGSQQCLYWWMEMSMMLMVWSKRHWVNSSTDVQIQQLTLSVSNPHPFRTIVSLYYRVIQVNVFFNFSLTDTKKLKNGKTQPFLLRIYLDILIFWCFRMASWRKYCLSGLCRNGVNSPFCKGWAPR